MCFFFLLIVLVFSLLPCPRPQPKKKKEKSQAQTGRTSYSAIAMQHLTRKAAQSKFLHSPELIQLCQVSEQVPVSYLSFSSSSVSQYKEQMMHAIPHCFLPSLFLCIRLIFFLHRHDLNHTVGRTLTTSTWSNKLSFP